MRYLYLHVVLGTNLYGILFLRNHGCVIQKGKGVTRAIVFGPYGRTTMLYVESSIVWSSSCTFNVLIHSRFYKKGYIH